MNIKVEESSGKKRYWVNNVPYNSLEEMPPEYREYFADKNNNGIPDQFDDLMEMTSKMSGSNPFSALFGKAKVTPEKSSKASSANSSNIDQYLSQQEEKPSRSSTFIKLVIGMVVIAVGAWAYVSFNKSDEVSGSSPELATTAEESADLNIDQENESDNKDGLTLVIEDPNEAPYHMLGVIYQNGKRVLSFELPDGENDETTDSSLQVAMNVPEGSNISQRTFRFSIQDGECKLANDATDDGKVNIGQIEFSKSESSDVGAGQRYQAYQYSFMKNGKCLSFVLDLHSGNAAAFDPPAQDYDEGRQVAEIEKILATLK